MFSQLHAFGCARCLTSQCNHASTSRTSNPSFSSALYVVHRTKFTAGSKLARGTRMARPGLFWSPIDMFPPLLLSIGAMSCVQHGNCPRETKIFHFFHRCMPTRTFSDKILRKGCYNTTHRLRDWCIPPLTPKRNWCERETPAGHLKLSLWHTETRRNPWKGQRQYEVCKPETWPPRFKAWIRWWIKQQVSSKDVRL